MDEVTCLATQSWTCGDIRHSPVMFLCLSGGGCGTGVIPGGRRRSSARRGHRSTRGPCGRGTVPPPQRRR
jgi:hypothetical protein